VIGRLFGRLFGMLHRRPAPPPPLVGAPFALRADAPEEDDDPAPDIVDAAETEIQERTRARMEALRRAQAESEVVEAGGEPPAGDGLSIDWSMAQSDDWENQLRGQKVDWLRRGAHHMGEPLMPLLPSPQESRLAGCERLMRLTQCDRLAPLVVSGALEPSIDMGRLSFLVAGRTVQVRTDEEVASGQAMFAEPGGVEFADVEGFEAWVSGLP